MDSQRLINYLESSFLHDLLLDSEITDISYNGVNIFYLHNTLGRRKSEVSISKEEASSFVRQISNISEKQFSYINPHLDISFGRYRFNATHQSIGRFLDESIVTFSIRITSNTLLINKDDGKFFPPLVGELIDLIINNHVSIVIGGETGSGKTELQKYMLTRFKDNTRVIIIDNVLELEMIRDERLDFNVWQADEKNTNTSLRSLVKNALRNNPDWLVVAESRGEEMIDVLNSAMTGHPIITTVHAFDVLSIPHRMTRMVLMNNKEMDFKDVKNDIYYHFKFYFYVKRKILKNGEVIRYLASIAIADEDELQIIYEKKKGKDVFYSYTGDLTSYIDFEDCDEKLKKLLGKEKK